jgi:hypothetical protein
LGPVRLRNHDIFIDLANQCRKAALQVRERRLGVIERIERHADEIYVRQGERSLVLDTLPPPGLSARVPAISKMYHELRYLGLATGRRGGVQQLRGRVEAILRDLADGPEKAVVDLVSDLEDVDGGALVLELVDDVECVPTWTIGIADYVYAG